MSAGRGARVRSLLIFCVVVDIVLYLYIEKKKVCSFNVQMCQLCECVRVVACPCMCVPVGSSISWLHFTKLYSKKCK